MADLPDWLAGITIEQIVGLMIALSVASFAGRKLWRGTRRLGALVDDLLGTPARPGVEARPGLMERVAGVEATTSATAAQLETTAGKVDTVHHQVLPNGGTSLRDEVTRTSAGLADAVERLDALDARLKAVEERTGEEEP
ncbi:hypothetical protein [Jiangella alkaliphila]|uniref:Uncharacterized protein n=1 Tax=Jiangella alkaliphila TaxID=419479 RepID=A0A1H2IFH3_9ACTN|nr:hypothetical protein [Jiangella alkaliphila]SDU42843.1 hypothetical protein SAMN04488563_1674 [Jiangella alkaliphila]